MKIKVKYTRTHDQRPLVTLDGGPFVGVELTLERLHALAQMLDQVEHVAEHRPVKGRLWMPATSEFTI
ncbi:hypothetical protein ABW38_10455 [Achromobacter xylosoxidans]|uniref:hypothetical protein n=1 Tax=Achromobacter TaxID=222 RepID=UPI0006AC8855|nr:MULTISPECIES: hypothetical protein [Achromobacter]KOQ29476.1 hypothetical protein ABW34_05590 [Achromobacter xylosoxidans]KOQ29753.1 hypothetical protein ABW35_03585 [Achromobacter xylosoxidans]KOQ34578.1 hypothetical protein ABW36_05445 [Achromobacter xylosoxidans]KOQ45543.1 hypothetical protein ABW37_05800 [Achromobacter xylosoxidans]KOQ50495.1 hypothetical protein ABW38_10455 [Achromobacter xylosoxidans]